MLKHFLSWNQSSLAKPATVRPQSNLQWAVFYQLGLCYYVCNFIFSLFSQATAFLYSWSQFGRGWFTWGDQSVMPWRKHFDVWLKIQLSQVERRRIRGKSKSILVTVWKLQTSNYNAAHSWTSQMPTHTDSESSCEKSVSSSGCLFKRSEIFPFFKLQQKLTKLKLTWTLC